MTAPPAPPRSQPLAGEYQRVTLLDPDGTPTGTVLWDRVLRVTVTPEKPEDVDGSGMLRSYMPLDPRWHVELAGGRPTVRRAIAAHVADPVGGGVIRPVGIEVWARTVGQQIVYVCLPRLNPVDPLDGRWEATPNRSWPGAPADAATTMRRHCPAPADAPDNPDGEIYP